MHCHARPAWSYSIYYLLHCYLASVVYSSPACQDTSPIARMLSALGGSDNRFGSSNYDPFLPIAYIPTIVAEWAAVLPLVCHLAGYQRDYQLVGRLALEGRLCVSLFPRLGVLLGLSKMLQNGSEFIDQASSKGSPSWKVWDVLWGSIFPCANCGASAMIVNYALNRRKKGVVDMPNTVPDMSVAAEEDLKTTTKNYIQPSPSFSSASKLSPPSDEAAQVTPEISSSQKIAKSTNNITPSQPTPSPSSTVSSRPIIRGQRTSSTQVPRSSGTAAANSGHRRYQTLHLLQCSHVEPVKSWSTKLDSMIMSAAGGILSFIGCVIVAIILCLFGLFGTATVVCIGAVSQLACCFFNVLRPQGYLSANEQESQTFMLAGLHQNTSTWYLFTGDRAIVDTLVNKTMIAIPPSRWCTVLSTILRFAHTAQLLAMTYVAAQKGWDGVSLVILIALDTVWGWRRSDAQVVRRWMEREGVRVEAKTFRFTGRTIMFGTIHSLGGSESKAWMDEILAPHPRRNAWLERLRCLQREDCGEKDVVSNENGRWNSHDWNSILVSSELALAAVKVIRSVGQTADEV